MRWYTRLLSEYLDTVGIYWAPHQNDVLVVEDGPIMTVIQGVAKSFAGTVSRHLIVTPGRGYVVPRDYRYAVPILRYLLKERYLHFPGTYALATGTDCDALIMPWQYALALPPTYMLTKLIAIDAGSNILHLYYRNRHRLNAIILDRIYGRFTVANDDKHAQAIVAAAWDLYSRGGF